MTVHTVFPVVETFQFLCICFIFLRLGLAHSGSLMDNVRHCSPGVPAMGTTVRQFPNLWRNHALATSRVRHSEKDKPHQLEKALTGIAGFDQITNGGLPKGRPTIVCGGPGCGKTMFAMEFLVRGATEFNEPGVLMTFEETGEEMTKNVASLGFDLKALAARKKLIIDYVKIEPAEIEETGAYDLEGLFVRLQYAVESIGAKRSRARHARSDLLRLHKTPECCAPKFAASSAGSRIAA